uniref:Coatomer subunit epsilon n=1 Tax=Culicoides sonorensis TaxID=179676 RepID=A0A336MJG1_CULSO
MARKDASSDDLFEIRNSFYIGNYQQCINGATSLRAKSLEKDLLVYRSYIAQKRYRIVLDEISSGDATSLQAVRKLAEYFAEPAKKEVIVKYFDDKLATPSNDLEDIWVIAAATVYYNEENYEAALKILHTADSLECKALQIQTLLKINRPDVAKKVYQQMQEKDDDATLTQLAHAWLSIEIGGEKLQDAYYIFQDFVDKFSSSVQLLNSQAVCNIGQQKYEDADGLLREALEKNSTNYDTLVNLITASQHLEKGENVNRNLSNLKDSHPDSPLITDYVKKENDFDRFCSQYAPSNPTPIVFS